MHSQFLAVQVFRLFVTFALLSPAIEAQTWKLVWRDDFDGTAVKDTAWTFMIGDGSSYGIPGWGNNELQYYTNANATVSDGFLTITARKEQLGGRAYTSSRLRTLGKGDWTYGRFEMRAKLPTGQGLWPAFWMMPSDNVYGGWAASGEIDIMEVIGSEPGRLHGTIHFGGAWPANVLAGASYSLPDGGSFADDFHTFGIEWKEGEITWDVDGSQYSTQTSWYTTGHDFPAPFDQRFHVLLNVAVGGNWPGSPDASTIFPQTMQVDYVAVYQDSQQIATTVAETTPFSNGPVLRQNYPNPFNPSTQIVFDLPQSAHVHVSVWDILGRQIEVLVDEERQGGTHVVTWNGAGQTNGVYVCRIGLRTAQAISMTESRSILLLR